MPPLRTKAIRTADLNSLGTESEISARSLSKIIEEPFLLLSLILGPMYFGLGRSSTINSSLIFTPWDRTPRCCLLTEKLTQFSVGHYNILAGRLLLSGRVCDVFDGGANIGNLPSYHHGAYFTGDWAHVTEYLYSKYILGNWRNNHRRCHWPTGPNCEKGLGQNFIYCLRPQAPNWLADHRIVLGPPGISINLETVSINTLFYEYFPFPSISLFPSPFP